MRAVHNAAFGSGADTAEAQLVDDLRADRDIIAPLPIVAVVDGDVGSVRRVDVGDAFDGVASCGRGSADGRGRW